jgi:hypothetical protein
MMCEDFVCFKQPMTYTWKKVGVLWRALKFTTSIVKTIVCWTLGLNFLEDPHTDSLYTFILNLTLIYTTLNPNLPLIYMFINR